MLDCYLTKPVKNSLRLVPIVPITCEHFSRWIKAQPQLLKNWVENTGFTAQPNTWCLIPDAKGQVTQVLLGITDIHDAWPFGALALNLPQGNYVIQGVEEDHYLQQAGIAWGLGAYQFSRYKTVNKISAKLFLPVNQSQHILDIVEASYFVRDLINVPAEDMGPDELAKAAVKLGKEFSATVTQIIGDDLLKKNYPAIHAVGRASSKPPRLIDLRWGNKRAPKITLVGKGICFDSGGLDIKSSANMLLMKKDMGGAAHALGLAWLLMQAKLPISLRVLIPAAENVIAGNAYRPGDIITTRKGLRVEIGNTDAEGRLVLADALTEAVAEKPELLIDFATLTGAARVAVGTDIAALFSNNDGLATDLINAAVTEDDPIWRLPLYKPYRKLLDSSFADINNAGQSGYAGAITAALFLQEFVPDNIAWAHFDFMAWNLSARPGHPEGGEAMTLRALFSYLSKRYSK